MTDEQADKVILAFLALAVTLRDEVGPAVTEAAREVLQASGGDALAAVTIAAAMVPVESPLDCWWQPPPRGPGRPLKPHGTHAAFQRHKAAGEKPCQACEIGEQSYQADRPPRQRQRPGQAAA